MNTHLNSSDNFNELLFENKNKAYGAYAIRKSEKDNISVSLLITSAFFGFLVLLTIVLSNNKEIIPDITGNLTPDIPYLITEVIMPPKTVEPPKMDKPEAPKSNSGIMTASDDKKNDLDKTSIDPVISKDPNPLGKVDSTEKKDPVVLPPSPPKKQNIVKVVSKMPRMEKMSEFIMKHLRYPEGAKINGTEGTVYVTFVVETDGTITDVQLLQGIGDGCEQEAMRVVGIMPAWEPGMDQDIPQRVQCNLPIKFRLK